MTAISRIRSLLIPLSAFLTSLLVWEAAARYAGWSRHSFPGPVDVLCSMLELTGQGILYKYTVASLFRVTSGFYLAVLTAVPLGMVLGRWRMAARLLNPLIQFLRPISPLAWIPLSVLWFGIGDKPAIFLIFMSSFFPLVVSTTIAARAVPPIYFQVAANFGFRKDEIVTKIIFPATLPAIITSLRISMGIAWIVVVAAEMIAVQSGLGYLILDSRNALRMDYVMAAMVTIGFIGLILDFIMKSLGKLAPPKYNYQ